MKTNNVIAKITIYGLPKLDDKHIWRIREWLEDLKEAIHPRTKKFHVMEFYSDITEKD